MENLEQDESNEAEEIKLSPLHTVTPLSKYLAMALFIALPFIGGWIGYTYAPEKIVEIEKVVIQEVPVQTQDDTDNIPTNEIVLEEVSCSDLPEISEILDSLDTNQENWNRFIFRDRDATCTKQVFDSGTVLYSMSAGCGGCIGKVYKGPNEYEQLNPFSQLFGDQIVTVNDRSVEVLNVNTGNATIVAELAAEAIDSTFFSGEYPTPNIVYSGTDNTISISVYDKNSCETVGMAGCIYTEIPSKQKTVTLP